MMGALVAIGLASIAFSIVSNIWPGVNPAWTIGGIAIGFVALHGLLLYSERRGAGG
jgi:hypothetical protein